MALYVYLYDLTSEASEILNRAGADAAASLAGSDGAFAVVRIINERLEQLSPEFAKVLGERMKYFSGLKEKGTLNSGGPFVGFKTGMLIFEADSLGDAISIVENDPLNLHGFMRRDFILREWYNLFS